MVSEQNIQPRVLEDLGRPWLSWQNKGIAGQSPSCSEDSLLVRSQVSQHLVLPVLSSPPRGRLAHSWHRHAKCLLMRPGLSILCAHYQWSCLTYFSLCRGMDLLRLIHRIVSGLTHITNLRLWECCLIQVFIEWSKWGMFGMGWDTVVLLFRFTGESAGF